jgi:ketosteroid isomerase-like protein
MKPLIAPSLLPLALALALAACTSAADTVLPPSAEALAARDASLAAEIVAVEEARLAAFRAADRAAFERLVSADLVMIHSDGSVGTRADEIANMRVSTPENPLPTLHLEETRVRGYGDAAVLTGALVERREGRAVLRLRFTNVYARAGGGWRLVSGQLTRSQAD